MAGANPAERRATFNRGACLMKPWVTLTISAVVSCGVPCHVANAAFINSVSVAASHNAGLVPVDLDSQSGSGAASATASSLDSYATAQSADANLHVLTRSSTEIRGLFHPTSSFPLSTASATAAYQDEIVVTPSNQPYIGLAFDVGINGQLTSYGSDDYPAGHSAAAITVDVKIRQNINTLVERRFREVVGTGPNQIQAMSFDTTLPIVWLGQGGFNIQLVLTAESNSYWFFALPAAGAEVQFINTVRVGNLRAFDADMNPVDFTFTSASGYDLTRPLVQEAVPEPSSLALGIGLGSCCWPWLRRRYRLRRQAISQGR
jgi:hypothetical protein